VTEAIGWALAAKESYAASHRIARPDGTVRWLYSAGRVFTGEDGEPERIRGLTWDVTDRWQSPPVGWRRVRVRTSPLKVAARSWAYGPAVDEYVGDILSWAGAGIAARRSGRRRVAAI
jgi:hypothetical protein